MTKKANILGCTLDENIESGFTRFPLDASANVASPNQICAPYYRGPGFHAALVALEASGSCWAQ